MKVVQFVPSLDSGGVEQGVIEIAKALVDDNHESHVVSSGGRLVDDLISSGSHHHKWDLGKKSLLNFRLIKPLRNWIVSTQPDIIHVRSRMPAWLVWKALNGIPQSQRPQLVSTVHGLHSVNFYSRVMTKPHNIIAVSQSSKNYIIDNYTKSENKNIKLIYRGVDNSNYNKDYAPSDKWLSDWYEQYPETKSAKLLTISGRISPLKDIEKIIHLAKSIKDNSSHNFKILIAGEAQNKHLKYLENLKNTIKYLGLSEDIYFLNFRKDIKDIYAISSLAFNTSNKPESFGRSVLEPLSMGVPTIGYNRGGVKEILDELYPFGGVTPGSDEQLLNKTLCILDGNEANIKTNTKFITSKMCSETLSFYKVILS